MTTAYERQLARVRAYNKTPRGRAVKRAARLRQLDRERASRTSPFNPQPLAKVIAQNWRT